MRANFDKVLQNSAKSSEKQRNFEGHETWTNLPQIFEAAIVLTRSKYGLVGEIQLENSFELLITFAQYCKLNTIQDFWLP